MASRMLGRVTEMLGRVTERHSVREIIEDLLDVAAMESFSACEDVAVAKQSDRQQKDRWQDRLQAESMTEKSTERSEPGRRKRKAADKEGSESWLEDIRSYVRLLSRSSVRLSVSDTDLQFAADTCKPITAFWHNSGGVIPAVHHGGTSVSDLARQPGAYLAPPITRAISSILVPFEITAEHTPLHLDAAKLHKKHQQLLSTVHAIFRHQPMRRFCWAVSFNRSSDNSDLLHILAVSRSGSQVFALKDPFSEGKVQALGAFLNFISFCTPTSLGFLPDVRPASDKDMCPFGDVLLDIPISPGLHQQEPSHQSITIRGQLTRPISLESEPWGRDTIAFSASNLSASTAQRQLVVKLTWLEDDHFVPDGSSIEGVVLEELGRTLSSDDPLLSQDSQDPAILTRAELRERIPSLVACKIFLDAQCKAKSGSKTAVLYLLEGQGDKLAKDSFKTIGDLMNYLLDMWRTYYSLWRAGVAHRDLSTNNVMVKDGRKCFLIDFGGSTFLDGSTLEPRPDAAHREGPLTYTPTCVPLSLVILMNRRVRDWATAMEVESLFHLTGRIIRLALDLGPLPTEQVPVVHSHNSRLQTISSGRAMTRSQRGQDSPTASAPVSSQTSMASVFPFQKPAKPKYSFFCEHLASENRSDLKELSEMQHSQPQDRRSRAAAALFPMVARLRVFYGEVLSLKIKEQDDLADLQIPHPAGEALKRINVKSMTWEVLHLLESSLQDITQSAQADLPLI